MPPIDVSILVNWMISGLIGLCFGIIGAYVAHKLAKTRDDLQWEHEKLKLEQQFKHDREQMEVVWQQKLEELKLQQTREDLARLRNDLYRGVDNPIPAIQSYTRTSNTLRVESNLAWTLYDELRMCRTMMASGAMNTQEGSAIITRLLQKLEAQMEAAPENKKLEAPKPYETLGNS